MRSLHFCVLFLLLSNYACGKRHPVNQFSYQYSSQHFTSTSTTSEKLSFERPPLGAHFSIDGEDFLFIGLHSQPKRAVEEVGFLDDVARTWQQQINPEHTVILGDLNLSCRYASAQAIRSLDLRTDHSYRWLIKDHDDTNVARSQCAYDRIIMSGALAGTAQGAILNQFKNFSDHYPVQAKVQGRSFIAFNGYKYSEQKARDPKVLNEFARIICEGDVVLLQEILSSGTKHLQQLRDRANQICAHQYELTFSARLGSTSYKERYAYFYRRELNLYST